MRPPARPERRAGDGPLLGEEGGDLVVGHPDLIAPAHRRTSRATSTRRRLMRHYRAAPGLLAALGREPVR